MASGFGRGFSLLARILVAMGQFILGSSNTKTVSAERVSAKRVPTGDKDGTEGGLRADPGSWRPSNGWKDVSAS